MALTVCSAYYDNNGQQGGNGQYQQDGYYDDRGQQGYQDDYYSDQYYDQGGQGYGHNGYGLVWPSVRSPLRSNCH